MDKAEEEVDTDLPGRLRRVSPVCRNLVVPRRLTRIPPLKAAYFHLAVIIVDRSEGRDRDKTPIP